MNTADTALVILLLLVVLFSITLVVRIWRDWSRLRRLQDAAARRSAAALAPGPRSLGPAPRRPR
jgi:Flp pilus assembly protein TadG